MTKRVSKVIGAEYLRGNVVPISQPNVSPSTPETSDWLEPLIGFLLWKKANGISDSTLKDYERFTRQFLKQQQKSVVNERRIVLFERWVPYFHFDGYQTVIV